MVAVNRDMDAFKTDLEGRVYKTWWLLGLVALQKKRVSLMTFSFLT